MKVFENEKSSWGSKVNFVDANDVFVGYDTDQDCCEDAGWFIAEEITPYDYNIDSYPNATDNFEPYVFDKDFFKEVESLDLEEGRMVAFKLTASGEPDLFLHLYNAHNGYYGHGFEVKHSGEVVKDETL